MDKRKYTDNDSTILYGVPKVGWGAYGGDTPYPICLKACLDYLGEDVGYPYVMVSGGAAFRLTWNEKNWDLSNVDIFHTRDESSSIYAFGAEALGRDFEFLGRDKGTRKEEFIQFIRRHIDNGYPCIAQGIIGPPEACVVTGYKDGGKTLLGWNFFQEDTEFAGQVEHDESGYFMCDSYWENTDTQGIMCLGPISGEMFTHDKIMRHAVEIMKGRKDSGYAKGIAAYDAWEKMIGDDAQFGQGDNDSMLIQKILCHNDAMVSLIDGRGCAAAYFSDLAKQTGEKEFSELAAAFGKTKDIVCRMREVIGGWDDLGNRLSDSSDTCLRKKICGLIRQAKEADEKSLQLMIQKLKF